MQRIFPTGLAGLLAVIGAGAIVAPRMSAGQYGLPTANREALAFVRAAGARDLIMGLTLVASLGDSTSLRRLLGWYALLGLADAAVLASARGLQRGLAVHLAGAAAFALAAALTKAGD